MVTVVPGATEPGLIETLTTRSGAGSSCPDPPSPFRRTPVSPAMTTTVERPRLRSWIRPTPGLIQRCRGNKVTRLLPKLCTYVRRGTDEPRRARRSILPHRMTPDRGQPRTAHIARSGTTFWD